MAATLIPSNYIYTSPPSLTFNTNTITKHSSVPYFVSFRFKATLSLPNISVCFSSPRPHKTSRLTVKAQISIRNVQEVIPPALTSRSDPPPLFDGTTRLYISQTCPFAQRAWITRNVKGLQDKIELVLINLKDRPAWYKEKVYPANKVPSLEHNNEVRGESLDLIRYIDSHFEGPSLFPDDPAKKALAEELLSYTDSFSKAVRSSFGGELRDETGVAFDHIENALSRFDDGPFFLGQFSLVDIAYAPFIERYQPFLLEVNNYDITVGRTKLAAWIEEVNKIEAYNQTRCDPEELLAGYKNVTWLSPEYHI